MSVVGDLILGTLLIVGVLVGVAFLTLFERSVLGYIQIRSAPVVVGFSGILQPFSDAAKLFLSGGVSLMWGNMGMFILAPLGGLGLSLLLWMVYPLGGGLFDFSLGVLFFLVCSSLGVYGIMLAGWASNSKYSLLGSYRAVAQTISYEVSMMLILLVVSMTGGSYDFVDYIWEVWMLWGWLGLFFMWGVTCVAELNRTPFDFSEGESELVSGFNVEYSGGVFALIFISEYSNIMLMGLVSVLVFLGGSYLPLSVVGVVFWVVWVRGVFVRYRYDFMMMLIWKGLLPVVMGMLVASVAAVGVENFV
uniref:NADH dehydrogenase subunit 1 n=1 Tax=Heterophrynus longicornis TaxID=1046789 RepID=UPI0024116B85|nr:NADH dehydrogenase subunit 1 [Heterophrynus longicornis]WEM34682.1 NADH dehydrogenase subunit 1 [Heterophrynus longicornis]